MPNDLPALFRAAHAAIGDEIVPTGYSSADVFKWAAGDPEYIALVSGPAINAGIVHTQQWLVKRHTGNVVSVSVDRIEYYDRERTQLHAPCFHDNTPSSIYAALLRLATRVKHST